MVQETVRSWVKLVKIYKIYDVMSGTVASKQFIKNFGR